MALRRRLRKSRLTADRWIVGVSARAQAIVLTSADPRDENTLDQPTKVAPVTKTVTLDAPAFRQPLPGHSVTVLRVPVGKE